MVLPGNWLPGSTRLAFLTGILGGLPVQAQHRTPFSWHPALLVAQFVILVVLASRNRFAVAALAWLSMGVLVTISFYPADRIPLLEIVAVLMDTGRLVGRLIGSRRAARRASRRGPVSRTPVSAVPA